MNPKPDDILRALSKKLNQNLFNVRPVTNINESLSLHNIDGIPIVFQVSNDNFDEFYNHVDKTINGRVIIGIAAVPEKIFISTIPTTAGPTVKKYFSGTEWSSITTSVFVSMFLFVEKV